MPAMASTDKHSRTASSPTHSKRVIPFKVDIVFLFCLIIIPTVIAVTTYTYKKNSAAALEMSNRLVEKITTAVIEKTTNFMSPAQVTSQLTAQLVRLPDVNILPGSDLEGFLMKSLISQPQIDFVYFGTEAGDFIDAVWLKEDEPITIKYIHHEAGVPVMTYRSFDRDQHFISEKRSRDVLLDPRNRPWYTASKAAKRTVWTDPYIFASTGKPGITAATPVVDQSGRFLGVAAADITFSELSAFLNRVKVSENGIVFIVDGKRQLIAFPDPDRMVKVKDGRMVPVQAVDLNDRRITAAIRMYEDAPQPQFTFEVDEQRFLAYFTPFPAAFGKEWLIVVLVPEDDFLGPIKETHQKTLYMSALILLLAIGCGLVFARTLSRPIETLTEEMQRIKSFNLEGDVDTSSYIYEIQMMANTVDAMKKGLQAFRRYVPAVLVRNLIESGEEAIPGGKEREITLFFSDIASFTAITEQLPARELMVNLSEYMDIVSNAIIAEKGTVDKYIGDAVMAFWGAPLPVETHALCACRAAIACQRGIRQLNQKWAAHKKFPFHTRIGLHTGFTIVGNMGSSERLNYTALGDNVNVASRLEGLNKLYHTDIVISEATYRYVRNDFILRPLDIIAVKGKTSGVKVFELMGDADSENGRQLQELAEAFGEVVEHYLKRRWKAALERLEALAPLFPDDAPIKLYTQRCRQYADNDPGPDWSGVIRLDAKL